MDLYCFRNNFLKLQCQITFFSVCKEKSTSTVVMTLWYFILYVPKFTLHRSFFSCKIVQKQYCNPWKTQQCLAHYNKHSINVSYYYYVLCFQFLFIPSSAMINILYLDFFFPFQVNSRYSSHKLLNKQLNSVLSITLIFCKTS